MQRSTRIIRKGKQKRNKQSEERYPEPWGRGKKIWLCTQLDWVGCVGVFHLFSCIGLLWCGYGDMYGIIDGG